MPEFPTLQTKFYCSRPTDSGAEFFWGFYHGGHFGYVTMSICINFHVCAPKFFHMVLSFKYLNSFWGKKRFMFDNRVTLREDQNITLTFETHVGS